MFEFNPGSHGLRVRPHSASVWQRQIDQGFPYFYSCVSDCHKVFGLCCWRSLMFFHVFFFSVYVCLSLFNLWFPACQFGRTFKRDQKSSLSVCLLKVFEDVNLFINFCLTFDWTCFHPFIPRPRTFVNTWLGPAVEKKPKGWLKHYTFRDLP